MRAWKAGSGDPSAEGVRISRGRASAVDGVEQAGLLDRFAEVMAEGVEGAKPRSRLMADAAGHGLQEDDAEALAGRGHEVDGAVEAAHGRRGRFQKIAAEDAVVPARWPRCCWPPAPAMRKRIGVARCQGVPMTRSCPVALAGVEAAGRRRGHGAGCRRRGGRRRLVHRSWPGGRPPRRCWGRPGRGREAAVQHAGAGVGWTERTRSAAPGRGAEGLGRGQISTPWVYDQAAGEAGEEVWARGP